VERRLKSWSAALGRAMAVDIVAAREGISKGEARAKLEALDKGDA
jgi:hypothetical protein